MASLYARPSPSGFGRGVGGEGHNQKPRLVHSRGSYLSRHKMLTCQDREGLDERLRYALPRYAAFTCGFSRRSAAGPSSTTLPVSKT